MPESSAPLTHRPARPRTAAVFALLVAFALVPVLTAPTAAWSNGGSGGNGYGTHDWMLDQALRILQASGKSPAWFDRTAALLKTDDPDTVEVANDPARSIEHVYRDSGKRGGAVHRIAELYAAAMSDYKARNYLRASERIGVLSHFYGDILQPYHTVPGSAARDDAHHEYELAVDARTKSPTDAAAWSNTSQTVSTISNVRTTAIAGAAYARARFADLDSAWRATRSVSNGTVSRLTGEVLKRGARDLANVIWSLSQGKGRAPMLGSLSASVKWVGVRPGDPYQSVMVKARDVNGRPIEGLEVRVAWPKAGGGVIRLRTWTDPTGYVKLVQGVGSLPMLVRQYVGVAVAVNGVTTTRSPWFIPSPRLADGSAGFKTLVSDATPSVGQVVTVTSIARDRYGRAVPGLLVRWTWDYNGNKVTTSGVTGSTGKARSSRTIRSTTTTATVKVTAHVQSYSSNRYSYTSFRRN